ncbi:hypothetical protein [Motilimonas eburnea]|uniref:hypothetical protein n=1 Tax=Motilimonas eburnea TaxID=1737488 RepID=UPI001E5AE4B5|nr:hypothetical protein [Motilimonas eburnea]MCE2573097.1 hypothetical protein [Motilimonas eburnea]
MDDKIRKDATFLALLGQGQPLQAQKYLMETYELGVVDASLRVRAMQVQEQSSRRGRFYRFAIRMGQLLALAIVALSLYSLMHFNVVNDVADDIKTWPRVTVDQWQLSQSHLNFDYRVAGQALQAQQSSSVSLSVATTFAQLTNQALMVAYQVDQPKRAFLYVGSNCFATAIAGLLVGLLLIAILQFFAWCHLRKQRRPRER